MYKVNIYAESDNTAPGCAARMAGYVLECRDSKGRSRTVQEFYEDIGTYHAVILKAIARAVKRLNQTCEVYIHTQNDYVLGMIYKNLSNWAANGYRTKKGDLVKSWAEWSRLYGLLKGHIYTTEEGMHSYYAWMLSEMAREKQKTRPAGKAAASGIS